MALPNLTVPCTIEGVSGHDAFGQPTKSAPVKTKCAVVKLEKTLSHSTVRADSASSRGHSEENRGQLVVLMRANETVNNTSVITIRNTKYRVNGIHERFDVHGKLDHLEVSGELV